jgi:hypothetical protein
MNATKPRPGAKLLTIQHAVEEYGLPETALWRLIHVGELASVRLPGSRRTYLRRAELEGKLAAWTEPTV